MQYTVRFEVLWAYKSNALFIYVFSDLIGHALYQLRSGMMVCIYCVVRTSTVAWCVPVSVPGRVRVRAGR